MNDPWSTCCPKCAAQIGSGAPSCWMCGHSFGASPGGGPTDGGAFGEPPPRLYAASAASSDAAQALWVIGSLGVLVLAMCVFLGLLVFSPGLSVIFAVVAVPFFVALYQFLRQPARTSGGLSPGAQPPPAHHADEPEGAPSPARTAAVVVSAIGIALFAILLLFVAAIVTFFIICSSMVHFN